MNNLVTHDHKRAEFAWGKVEETAKDGTEKLEKYRNLSKAVASLIMNSGLMQTLAFLEAKGEDHHKKLKQHFCKWLGRTLGGVGVSENHRFPAEDHADFVEVMKSLYQCKSDFYLRATSETMALLRWIRQFADARYSMEKREKRP